MQITKQLLYIQQQNKSDLQSDHQRKVQLLEQKIGALNEAVQRQQEQVVKVKYLEKENEFFTAQAEKNKKDIERLQKVQLAFDAQAEQLEKLQAASTKDHTQISTLLDNIRDLQKQSNSY